MPNGEQYQEGVDSDGESSDNQYVDDSEDDSEDSSSSSKEVDSPPRSGVVPNSRKTLQGDVAKLLHQVQRFQNALGCRLPSH